MSEEEKQEFKNDIEEKYSKGVVHFLNTIDYAECLYILKPENKYSEETRELALLKIVEKINTLKNLNNDINGLWIRKCEEYNQLERKSEKQQKNITEKDHLINDMRKFLFKTKMMWDFLEWRKNNE